MVLNKIYFSSRTLLIILGAESCASLSKLSYAALIIYYVNSRATSSTPPFFNGWLSDCVKWVWSYYTLCCLIPLVFELDNWDFYGWDPVDCTLLVTLSTFSFLFKLEELPTSSLLLFLDFLWQASPSNLVVAASSYFAFFYLLDVFIWCILVPSGNYNSDVVDVPLFCFFIFWSALSVLAPLSLFFALFYFRVDLPLPAWLVVLLWLLLFSSSQ